MIATIGADISAGEQLAEKNAGDAIVAPLAAKDKVTTQYNNAVTEHSKATARQEKLEMELEPLKVAAANAVEALAAGKVKDVQADVDVAEAGVVIARLDPFLTAAKKAGDRAAAYFKFYNDYTVDAKARVDAT